MEYQVVANPTEQDIMDVRGGLRTFNDPFVEHLNELQMAVFVLDENGQRRGGIVSRFWGNWMHILFLWIDPALKGEGVGKTLMQKMETEAVGKGCKAAMVDTFSFQARPFYESMGYHNQMTLDAFPGDEHQLHFLTKKLVG
ncbi:putative acetyltransferase [Grimontia celer]|uniref:Putative acetyltransferase n=1 Tax=Grimontia celer TaxID=1796497 RepID=A0A128F312_9GAMM|nr:GNAT family N-acetyltransferase [Grimontia celer]CZF80651.1 putative acetyltransferase [Grimontia celer]